MSEPVFGIDLGTTNSVVAMAERGYSQVLPDSDGYPLVPSVVSFHPSGDVLAGRKAKERRLLDAKNTVYSVKRLIGRPFRSDEVREARERFSFELREGPTGGTLVAARNETYTLSEISAFVLREVRRVAEGAIKRPCLRAVVTVPANFNELQRNATKAAGKIAGLDVARILNEPTAAALAYGYGRGSKERIAVFDLGGGTFDVTILDLAGEVFEVLATAGDTYLGGDDLDLLVANEMATAFLERHRYDPRQDSTAFERLRVAGEWAKCQLSTEHEVKLRVEELAYGPGGSSLDLSFSMSRASLEAMAEPLLRRAFQVCEEAMRIAGVRPSQLDNVLLVGGSTRMPIVHRMVADFFGREPLAHLDPDLVVAQGAAIQAHALSAAGKGATIGRVTLRRLVAESIDEGPDTDEQTMPSGISRVDEEEPTLSKQPLARVKPTTLPAIVPPPPPAAVLPRPAPPSTSGRPPPPPLATTLRSYVPPPPVSAAGEAAIARERASDAPSKPEIAIPEVRPDRQRTLPPRFEVKPLEPRPPLAAKQVEPTPIFPDPEPENTPPEPVPFMRDAPPPEPAPMGLPPALVSNDEARPMPLLLDVTPHSLAIETVSGYCEVVIPRNAPIPVEETRHFGTAQDNQDVVKCRIYQGESRRIETNQELGEIELAGLPRAARGRVTIAVAFALDANGTLDVTASDAATGKKQTVRIHLLAGASDDEIAQLRARQEKRMR